MVLKEPRNAKVKAKKEKALTPYAQAVQQKAMTTGGPHYSPPPAPEVDPIYYYSASSAFHSRSSSGSRFFGVVLILLGTTIIFLDAGLGVKGDVFSDSMFSSIASPGHILAAFAFIALFTFGANIAGGDDLADDKWLIFPLAGAFMATLILSVAPIAHSMSAQENFEKSITQTYEKDHHVNNVSASFEGRYQISGKRAVVYRFTDDGTNDKLIAYSGKHNTITSQKTISENQLAGLNSSPAHR